MQKQCCRVGSIYIFVTFFFFCSLLSSCSLSNSPIPADSVPPIISFSREEISTKFYNDYYTLKGSIPRIDFPQNQTKEENLNSIINVFLTEETSYWTQNIQDNEALDTLPVKGELWVEFEAKYSSLEKISFLFFFSIDLGGAHPEEYSKCLNIDVLKATQLISSDLFLSQSSYLPLLSKISKNGLIEQFNQKSIQYDKEWLYEGTAPKLENFNNICISPEGLMITFNPYQVSSYSNGFQSIIVPYKEVCKVMAFKPNPDAIP